MRKLAPSMGILFADRREAGRRLAERLAHCRDRDCIVLAIPRGGVPVGYEVSRRLDCALDVVVPRKLPIPWSPEAGFGAVMPDGTRVLNQPMVRELGLSQRQIDAIAEGVLQEVRRRQRLYRGDRPPAEVVGRAALLVDDGLATGYTMLAALRAVRKRKPACIIVAVPVCPGCSADQVGEAADELITLHVSNELPFAVASFYRLFPDVDDEQIERFLAARRAA
jgi:putative phosphoribosyl transferase